MRSPAIIFTYAGFLAVCGFVAFALSGFESKARTALIVGCGTAFVMIVCGLLARAIAGSKTASMIGIHLGMILPLIFAGLFGWRAYGASADPAKLYLAVILGIMSLGSVIAFIMILRTRPKAELRA